MKTIIFKRIYKSGHINTYIVLKEGEVSRPMLLTHVSATHSSAVERVKIFSHNCAYGVFRFMSV